MKNKFKVIIMILFLFLLSKNTIINAQGKKVGLLKMVKHITMINMKIKENGGIKMKREYSISKKMEV